MTMSYPLFITFSAYFGLLFFLGLKAYGQTQSVDDYILGGRKLGPTLVALSVGASDMRMVAVRIAWRSLFVWFK